MLVYLSVAAVFWILTLYGMLNDENIAGRFDYLKNTILSISFALVWPASLLMLFIFYMSEKTKQKR